MQDSFFMQQAIDEALKADPNKVYPNPLVGCVIVKNQKIIGRGYHKQFGTNHAEVNAIESLSQPVKNADLYVTLEPCAHFGKSPPCVNAIIKSKMFKKVIIAVADPNKKAMGELMSYKMLELKLLLVTVNFKLKELTKDFSLFFKRKDHLLL